MAIINVPNAVEVLAPVVAAISSSSGAVEELLDPSDTSSDVLVGFNAVLAFPDYSGTGGGSIRPSTGQVYPRGF